MHGQSEFGVAAAPVPSTNTWDRIKALLAEQLAPQEFENWIAPTVQLSLNDGLFRVQVPDPVTKDFLEQEFAGHVDVLIHNLHLPIAQVTYVPLALWTFFVGIWSGLVSIGIWQSVGIWRSATRRPPLRRRSRARSCGELPRDFGVVEGMRHALDGLAGLVPLTRDQQQVALALQRRHAAGEGGAGTGDARGHQRRIARPGGAQRAQQRGGSPADGDRPGQREPAGREEKQVRR